MPASVSGTKTGAGRVPAGFFFLTGRFNLFPRAGHPKAFLSFKTVKPPQLAPFYHIHTYPYPNAYSGTLIEHGVCTCDLITFKISATDFDSYSDNPNLATLVQFMYIYYNNTGYKDSLVHILQLSVTTLKYYFFPTVVFFPFHCDFMYYQVCFRCIS